MIKDAAGPEANQAAATQGQDRTPLLQVQGLSIIFGSGGAVVPAVRDVDLSIAPGEIVALVGESGSGKSTVGNALMGLLRFDLKVRIDGKAMMTLRDGRTRDLLTLSDKAMRRVRGDEISMIFQEPQSSLNPIFRIGQQIIEAIRSHRKVSKSKARAQALELLEELGLPNPERCMQSYPHEISGGMRQRVMIAMALSCDPLLLIADEPTTALDVTIQAQIIDLLKKVQARTGMAILFITHDLGLVSEIADRVLVMYAGQIVESASINQVFSKPRMPYTRALLDAMPDLGCSLVKDYRLKPISGQAPSPAKLPKGCAFHPRCQFAQPDPCTSTFVALDTVGSGHVVRCARWRELDLGGTE